MKPARPTLEEYRSLSAEERELVRLGDARAFALGEVQPTLVKRRKLKNFEAPGEQSSTITKAQLVAAVAEGAELNAVQATRAVEVLAHFVGTASGDVAILGAFGRDDAVASRRKNMDALVEANNAAVRYNDLLKMQIAIVDQVMAGARKHFDATKIGAKTIKGQAEIAKAALLKSLTNMQALAEIAQRTNAAAYAIVSAQIQILESLTELRMAGDADRSAPASPR